MASPRAVGNPDYSLREKLVKTLTDPNSYPDPEPNSYPDPDPNSYPILGEKPCIFEFSPMGYQNNCDDAIAFTPSFY